MSSIPNFNDYAKSQLRELLVVRLALFKFFQAKPETRKEFSHFLKTSRKEVNHLFGVRDENVNQA